MRWVGGWVNQTKTCLSLSWVGQYEYLLSPWLRTALLVLSRLLSNGRDLAPGWMAELLTGAGSPPSIVGKILSTLAIQATPPQPGDAKATISIPQPGFQGSLISSRFCWDFLDVWISDLQSCIKNARDHAMSGINNQIVDTSRVSAFWFNCFCSIFTLFHKQKQYFSYKEIFVLGEPCSLS